MRDLGDNVLPGLTIDPHQFLGIEINPRAAALAELVLWIGSIQWYKRTRDSINIPEPILKDYGNIECRDAVLDWDSIEPVVDNDGNPVTRWDGRTTKPHPVTGEEVPDEDARVQEQRYINPRKAKWPEAEYIVGNPPFIGAKRMRFCLGDGYVDALQAAWPDVPQATDYVLRWWHKAALLVGENKVKRSGLIGTNSITQSYNRRAISPHLASKKPVSLLFAIADHPWVDSALGAAVRISMSVIVAGEVDGTLAKLHVDEDPTNENKSPNIRSESGRIFSNFRIGPPIHLATQLESNDGLCAVGMKTIGSAFQIELEKAEQLGLGRIDGLEKHIRPYVNGRDLAQTRRGKYIVDFYGVQEADLRVTYPDCFQYLLNNAKPDRDQNRNEIFRSKWWVIGHPRQVFRDFTEGLDRYVATIETSKHRFFVFFESEETPDSTLVTFGLREASSLGVLSSKIHVCWALAAGGTLEDRPRYNKTTCFETFPFPATDNAAKKPIGDLAEQLDAHRKRQQKQHPKLTMTGMYNVLEKLRSGETLTAKEQTIHEQGLVSVLKQIHDDLDAAVFDAYGWPHDLDDEAILQRLVDLNHERADEESRGIVRWLRPDFQNPDGATQTAFTGDDKAKPTKKAAKTKIKKQPWPKTLPDRMVAIQSALQRHSAPADAKEVAAYYTRANKSHVNELLETLVAVGNVRQLDDGRYTVFQ
jgi:hypothetical protein